MRSEYERTSNLLGDGNHVFNDDLLWAQLEHGNEHRRRLALVLVDALADLAALRAKRRGTSFLIERHNIFKMIPLEVDMEFGDPELRTAACRVLEEAMMLEVSIDLGDDDKEPDRTSDEFQETSRRLYDWAHDLIEAAVVKRARKS